MNKEKVLNILIVAEFGLSIAAFVCDRLLEPLFPAQLQAYLETGGGKDALVSDTVLMSLWVGVVVSTVVAWTGLVNLWKAARPLYCASWVAYLALIFVAGSAVEVPVVSVLNMLVALVGGMIVSAIYFSELSARFRRFPRSVGELFGEAA